jgi:2-dehydro-3-deoxygluconokinase
MAAGWRDEQGEMTGALVCFGEMLVRLTAPAGEMLLQTPRLSAHIGGAEANVAIGYARLGGVARMATVLPDNPLGRAARDELRRHGVDISSVRFQPGRMGLYYLTPGAVLRAPEIVYDRAGSTFALASPEAIDWSAALQGADWLHVSGITPAVSEAGGRAALAALESAARLGVRVSFDGNHRASLWKARGETGASILREILGHATLAFIDERDIGLMLDRAFTSRDAAASAAFAAFPELQLVVATVREARGVHDHSLGASLHARDGECRIEPIALPGVVDRIGAGDAFAAGFHFALSSGDAPEAALAFALHAAAAKHGQVGDAGWASASDVRALMAGRGYDVKR